MLASLELLRILIGELDLNFQRAWLTVIHSVTWKMTDCQAQIEIDRFQKLLPRHFHLLTQLDYLAKISLFEGD